MRPSFNTADPCIPGEHYMLPPERRLDRVMELIEQGKYFALHAGRQTGKTTSARWIAQHLNGGERCQALWVDIQTARGRRLNHSWASIRCASAGPSRAPPLPAGRHSPGAIPASGTSTNLAHDS